MLWYKYTGNCLAHRIQYIIWDATYVTGRLHPTIKIVTTELRAVLCIPIRPEQNFAGSGAQITNQDSDLYRGSTHNFHQLKKLVRENLFCLKFLRCSINNLFPFFKFLRKTFTCYVLQVLTFKYRSRSRIIFDRIRSTASGYYNYYRNVPT